MPEKANNEPRFKTLSVEGVWDRAITTYERLQVAVLALEQKDDKYFDGGVHVIKDAQEVLSEIFADVEFPKERQRQTEMQE